MNQKNVRQADTPAAKKQAEEEARAKQARGRAEEEARANQEEAEAREAEARRKKEWRTEKIADDLLDGAQEIADELGTNKREVYHLHKTRRLPIGRMGKKLIAFRSQLRRAARALTIQQKVDAA